MEEKTQTYSFLFVLHIFMVSSLITLSLSPPDEALLTNPLSPLIEEGQHFFARPGKTPYLTLDFCPGFLSTPLVTLLEGVRVSSEAQRFLMAGYPDEKS